jgi:hypothetical protein
VAPGDYHPACVLFELDTTNLQVLAVRVARRLPEIIVGLSQLSVRESEGGAK